MGRPERRTLESKLARACYPRPLSQPQTPFSNLLWPTPGMQPAQTPSLLRMHSVMAVRQTTPQYTSSRSLPVPVVRGDAARPTDFACQRSARARAIDVSITPASQLCLLVTPGRRRPLAGVLLRRLGTGGRRVSFQLPFCVPALNYVQGFHVKPQHPSGAENDSLYNKLRRWLLGAGVPGCVM